jgi:hypothetical protein
MLDLGEASAGDPPVSVRCPGAPSRGYLAAYDLCAQRAVRFREPHTVLARRRAARSLRCASCRLWKGRGDGAGLDAPDAPQAEPGEHPAPTP